MGVVVIKPECPECGKPLEQTVRVDYCPNCGYTDYYPSAV